MVAKPEIMGLTLTNNYWYKEYFETSWEQVAQWIRFLNEDIRERLYMTSMQAKVGPDPARAYNRTG